MIKWLKLLFSQQKTEYQFPEGSEDQLIKYYYELDSELKKQEEKKKKELDMFFWSLMVLALGQLDNVRNGQIVFSSKKYKELKIILEEHFLASEKIAHKHGKDILKQIIPKVRNTKDIIKAYKRVVSIKQPKYTQYNHEYANELGNKEIYDYKKALTSVAKKLLSEQNKPKLLPASKEDQNKQLEELLKRETQSFINKRSQNISSTEANRAVNAFLGKIFKESQIVRAMRFTAILDDRTTNICRARDGLIMTIERFLAEFLPPLHWHCRSYGVPLGKWNKFNLSPEEAFLNLPKPWFAK